MSEVNEEQLKQARLMTQQMSADMQKMKNEIEQSKAQHKEMLKQLSEQKESLKQQLEARDAENNKMRDILKQVQERDAAQYKKQLEGIAPFFEQHRKKAESNEELCKSVENVNRYVEKGVENAFMDEDMSKQEPLDPKSLFRFVEACASADAINSSALDSFLKKQAESGQQIESLQNELEQTKKSSSEKITELENLEKAKTELIEKLKEELKALKATAEDATQKANANPNNTDAHFQENAKPAEVPMETEDPPETVNATASKERNSFTSIFKFKPNTSWRSDFRDPGVSPHSTQFRP